MNRALVAGVVLAVAAADAAPLAVLQPDGWEEDRATEAQLANHTENMRVYRPPGDGENRFIVERFPGFGDDAIAQLVTQLQQQGATLDARTKVDGNDDLVFTFGNGTREHVRAAQGKLEGQWVTLTGACIGRGDAFAACEARLWSISLPVDPADAPVDTRWFRGVGVLISLAAALAFVAAMALRALLRRRALRRSAPLVDHELVTITGIVQPLGDTLEAALSGTRCVVHRTRARIFASRGSVDVIGEPVELATVPFALRTPRGVVRVDAKQLELAVPPGTVIAGASERGAAFLARHDIPREQRDLAAFDEIVIVPGDTITLHGMIELARDGAAAGERGYRDDAPAVARLVAPHDQQIRVVRVF
jgi:hypothetical protein